MVNARLGGSCILTADIWFLLAIGFSLAGYAAHLIGLRRELVAEPCVMADLEQVATSLEALTCCAVNPGAPQGCVRPPRSHASR